MFRTSPTSTQKQNQTCRLIHLPPEPDALGLPRYKERLRRNLVVQEDV